MWKYDLPGQRRWRNVRGLSLTEIMVGLALGLMIALVALNSLVSTRLTASTLDDAVRLQQKAEDIFQNIGQQVMQAGAIHLVNSAEGNGRVMFSGAFTGYDPEKSQSNGRIFAIHGVDANPQPSSDTLRTSHQDNGFQRDCLGRPPLAALSNIRVDSEYWVNSGRLSCRGNGNLAPQLIADGVEAFKVRYGVQTLSGSIRQYRFHRASEISDWSSIHAVHVCLQLVGDTSGHPPSSQQHPDCDGQVPAPTGRMRRVFLRTFSVRNALP